MNSLKVAIVGRQNVGKSTLFNRLAGKRLAVVDKTPGVTRDPVKTIITHKDSPIELWDTGGFLFSVSSGFEEKVNEKIREIIQKSDLILFITDGRSGIVPSDLEIASYLRKFEEKVLLTVNKIDSPELSHLKGEFYSLGFKNILGISAQTGRGIYELLEKIAEIGKEKGSIKDSEKTNESNNFKVCIAGRPNVGKSTLFNTILGKERVIVSSMPGTTRDLIEEEIKKMGLSFLTLDTPGIKRRSKTPYGVDFFSIGRSLRAIEMSDIVIVVCDATEGITNQDQKILSLALRKGKGALIALNKWDIIKNNKKMIEELNINISRKLRAFPFVPVVKISALKRENIRELFKKVKQVIGSYIVTIPTPQLNRFIREIIEENPLNLKRKGVFKVYYSTQISTSPPHFLIFGNTSEIETSYLRFIKNSLREKYNIIGTEILVEVRGKER